MGRIERLRCERRLRQGVISATIHFWRGVPAGPSRGSVQRGRRCDKYYTTKEYSYRAQHSTEDGLVLVGDAFAFLDPVFSSGVYLAMRGGELVADTVDDALEAGDFSASRFGPYADRMRREIESMRKLVYAFYDTTFSFGKFIRARPDFHGDLTDCLIGNLNKAVRQKTIARGGGADLLTAAKRQVYFIPYPSFTYPLSLTAHP